MRYLFLNILLFSLFSCEQDELPIAPHSSGNVFVVQIELESDYKNQVFYSIDNKQVISENLKTDWDLGFESSSLGWRIILNSSTYSQAIEITDSDFYDPIDVSQLDWSWDNPKGINEGTAIGDHRGRPYFYIIDRGYDLNGTSRGYRKMRVDSVTDSYYIITYAKLDNSHETTSQINKSDETYFNYFSFTDQSIVNIAPSNLDWDLLFTQYTHIYNDNETTPSYLVTGVLINYLNNIEVSKDTLNSFDDITYEMAIASNYTYLKEQDIIGFDWKSYDFDNQLYSVDPNIVYIIKTEIGRYHKLHFIDFYNSTGEKGYPIFQIQEL